VAASSDPLIVAVTYSGATSPATYSISEITSVARAASETSQTGYADSSAAPVSATGTLKLVIGSEQHTITLSPTQNNLAGLRDAINNLGAGVNASVLTTGTGANPNYLSVTAAAFGETTLQLFDDPDGANTNLLTAANQGSNAVFKLNGVNVSKPSNVINDVVSGASFTILDTTDPGVAVTLSLSTSRAQLQGAVRDLAARYNALASDVGTHVGPGAGVLSGDFIVREIQQNLRQLLSYEGGSGAIRNLSDFGIELGADGKMTFNTETFDALPDTSITAAFEFLGSESTGFGGLSRKFSQISDPVSGLARLQQDTYDTADRRLQSEIDTLTERITALQTSLNAKLQAADAILAQLDSQQRILDASLEALTFSTFGRKDQ
jgi:flagellar hook-associated protein 2